MMLEVLTNIDNKEKLSSVPIVFLHAFPLSLRMWKPQMEYLEAHRVKYLAVNYPGFGKSPLPENITGDTGMGFYAENVQELIQAFHLPPAIFVGLSMGGYVAFALYRRWPEQFAGLVLSNTRASADNEAGRSRRIRLIEDLTKTRDCTSLFENHLLKFYTSRTLQENKQLIDHTRKIMEESTLSGIILALKAMANRSAAFDLLASMNFPVLVIAGAADELTTIEDARKMGEQLKNARLEIIEDAAHLSNLEKPEIFNRHLFNYWQQINSYKL